MIDLKKIMINIMIFISLFVENLYNTIHEVQYGLEPFPIERILIGFVAILEKKYYSFTPDMVD